MRALIQEWPLLCHRIIDYAAIQHGAREVVSRSVEGPIVRTSYAAIRARALKVRTRLAADGFNRDDRIATLAWNTSRHVEAWYGVMGAGMICHTLNPRLFPEQLAWIMNDADDRMVFVDLTFVPLMEKIAPLVPGLRRIVVLTDAAHMPRTSLSGAVAYEDWIAEATVGLDWLPAEETDAVALCYTSGTTGNPKGVLYSHRSNVLHAMMVTRPDAMEISSRDTVMPVVPMFHANAWGIAHAAPMAGAKLVMPGGRMDGEAIWELLDSERVTLTAAVPTVWLMLLEYLRQTGKTLPWLKRVVIGGSASPRAMTMAFEKDYDVEVIHAWGMTEMSPVGSLTTLKPENSGLAGDQLYDLKQKQGFAPFGVEMKLVDDEERQLDWDGKTFGRLKVRGMAVASSYYGGTGADSFDSQGWFETGDVAHIDQLGYMQITDRAKDVIKSGGEWISTIDLENLAVAHPDVAEAAVIGIADPKWDERPLLIVVARAGAEREAAPILSFMEGKIAKWWIPDEVAFVDEIPHTATGKINKVALREMFSDRVS
ncbi:fatty-acyl-CoA synthase [Hoeflea marina]|uniref:3-methylmercaptopropionyl-CoA ligase n=1 Tax=Hoeflea marina TaxID=274592 RepID=A0A317PGK3_9HYPH|nr:long-chain-fatty-acid--CoA ligase [Hoeflea marina]PWV95772.1 fatty-acyl-CoA synthase [Hoeflea marina]